MNFYYTLNNCVCNPNIQQNGVYTTPTQHHDSFEYTIQNILLENTPRPPHSTSYSTHTHTSLLYTHSPLLQNGLVPIYKKKLSRLRIDTINLDNSS